MTDPITILSDLDVMALPDRVPPAQTMAWFNRSIRRYRDSARRSEPDSWYGTHADWLDTTGRQRLIDFLNEYDITRHLDRDPSQPRKALALRRTAAVGFDAKLSVDDMDRYPDDLPFYDHMHWWKNDVGELLITASPYADTEMLAPVYAWAASVGLVVDVRWDLDFYSDDDATPLLIWRRA